MKILLKPLVLCVSVLFTITAMAQQKPPENGAVAGIPVNYDEAQVAPYTLPDVLTLQNGQKVTDVTTWAKKRRPELIKLYEENQFGKMPARPAALKFNVFDKGTPVFDGKAIRKQITIYFTSDTSAHKMELLVYLPAKADKPVPLMIEVNFAPNSTAVDDPGIKTSLMWTKDGKRVPVPDRTSRFGKLNVDKFLSQGIAVATLCYTDIEPDMLNAATWGIRGQYLPAGKTEPAPDEWGSISAWAWGISRAMDYLTTDKQINPKRIAIHGTSRLGKTVLWAGAHDQRIALVIASCSGEGGAALSRRNYGETIAHLTAPTRYPYQFAGNWAKFGTDPNTSPVDAHMLVALMAPRPVLLQTGDADYWSDPKGEFLSAIAAEPVFKLFGKTGPGTTQWPAATDTVMAYNTLGYYMHNGKHGTVPTDWDIFVEYLKRNL